MPHLGDRAAAADGRRVAIVRLQGRGEMKSRLLIGALVLTVLALMPASALATDANGNHDTYTWVVGATTPSATAVAPDGSTITMTGSGTFTAGPGNAANGGGTYSLSAGGSGTFAVTGIQGFVSYGDAGSPGLFGGEAKLNVTLSNGASGVLTIICLLGSPPAGKEEGITVILGKAGQFTKQDGGNTVFISS